MTPAQLTPEKTYRDLWMLWFAFVVSIGMYYFVATTLPAGSPDANSPLVLPMFGIAILELSASVFCRMRFGSRAGQLRSLMTVRTGYIIAFVLSEAVAISGLILYFVARWPRYWIFFLLGCAGLLLNVPRREDLKQPRV